MVPLSLCVLSHALLLFSTAVFMPIYVLEKYPSTEVQHESEVTPVYIAAILAANPVAIMMLATTIGHTIN
jgi:hypothetical protein